MAKVIIRLSHPGGRFSEEPGGPQIMPYQQYEVELTQHIKDGLSVNAIEKVPQCDIIEPVPMVKGSKPFKLEEKPKPDPLIAEKANEN